jgi:hypothetical protein
MRMRKEDGARPRGECRATSFYIFVLSYLLLVHPHEEVQRGVSPVHDLVIPVLDEGALWGGRGVEVRRGGGGECWGGERRVSAVGETKRKKAPVKGKGKMIL